MLIKVQKTTFGFCENLNPKLRDYSMRTGSWLPALVATTDQPFGMHFEHVHVPTSSPCLPPLLGPRFLLAPMWESDFDLGLRKKFHLSKPFWQPFLYIPNVHDAIFWIGISLYFIYNLMWYIYATPCPTKRNVMSSSRFTSLLPFCRSSVEFFYGFLGMFQIIFIHPRCLYWMITFPLN
jgi:hypothetical protein